MLRSLLGLAVGSWRMCTPSMLFWWNLEYMWRQGNHAAGYIRHCWVGLDRSSKLILGYCMYVFTLGIDSNA